MALHYNAFISYKHAPADIAVAREVQHRLEHYHIPAAVRKKTGRDRIERIFRDQEELPITSDLSKDIDYALRDADYLIVICSSSTKLSTWVPREIARFLEFHDRDHILTVLVDGEPNEVIPPILLKEEIAKAGENGTEQTVTKIYEPLSCDFRGNIRQAAKTEIPRLAAALLGCSYDELVMRARQYKRRRLTALASAAAVMAAVAIGYLIWSNRQIRSNYERAEENRILAEQNYQKAEENRRLAEENFELAEENYEKAHQNLLEARRSQITFLANESIKARNREERILAAQLALAALPEEDQEDWPRMALPEYALTRAINAYTPYYSGSTLNAVWDMEMRGNILDFKIHRGKNLLFAYDFFGDVCGWDIGTYKELFHLIPGKDIDDIFIVSHGDATDLLVDDEDSVYLVEGRSGKILWTFDGSGFSSDVTRTAAFIDGDQIYVFLWGSRAIGGNAFLGSEDFIAVVRLDPESGKIGWQSEVMLAEIGFKLVHTVCKESRALYFCDETPDAPILYRCDLESGQITEVSSGLDFWYVLHLFEAPGGRLVLYGVTKGEKHLGSDTLMQTTLLAPRNVTLLCLDPENGGTVWQTGFSSTALQYLHEDRSSWVMDHTDPQGQLRPLLLIIHGQTVRFFDLADGSLYEEWLLDASPVSINTTVDGNQFLSVLRNGNVILYELDGEEQYSVKRFEIDTAYQAVLAFPRGDMAFVIKTDRTKLQLFEQLYDADARYFDKGGSYDYFSDLELYHDRWFAICRQPGRSGSWNVDLYDLESKKCTFSLKRTFEGSGVKALGLDPSGRYLVLTQNYPYQVLVFDTLNSDPGQEPVCRFDPQEETGLRFTECRMTGGRICLLQLKYNWTESEVFLLLLDLQNDGSLKLAERVSVPLDPATDYYTRFLTGDDENRFYALLQYSSEKEDEEPVIHLYDTASGEWLRPAFAPEVKKPAKMSVDHLPSQKLFVLTDSKKVQVFDAAGKALYAISDPALTVEAVHFCPADKTGLAEDLLLVVTRGEDYRMDRYLAKDGTFIGSSDIASYNSDISRSVWRFDKGEAVVLLDGVINFFNAEEWVFTGCAGQCETYSSAYRTVVSVENIDGCKPVWYPRYTLEELIEKGKEFLKGLELSDSEKSIYGISD